MFNLIQFLLQRKEIYMIKSNNTLPNILTHIEINNLLAEPSLRYPTGLRNYALIKLILNSGLKLSEITSLKWKDLDLITGDLATRGDKILRARTLWIDEEILSILEQWKFRQKKRIGECQYIFTTLTGGKLNNRYVRKMINRYANKAEIKHKVSPQTLRHTYATNLYEETGDLTTLGQKLGLRDSQYIKMYSLLSKEYFN